jgi:DNA-binding MarR family transcriptional regulator
MISKVYNVTLMNNRIMQLKRIVQQSLFTTGVIRYNITYIPKLNAYKITLVSGHEGISGSTLSKLIDALSSNGFVTRVKVNKTPVFNVIYIYTIPKANVT